MTRATSINIMNDCLILALLLVSTLSSPCSPYNRTEISAQGLSFTSAGPIGQGSQARVMQIYKDLTVLGEYQIALEYGVYSNVDSLCDKGGQVQMINSLSDIWLCFDPFYLLTCNQVWKLAIKCGTFVEIHRPFDPTSLAALNLENVSWITDERGEKIINLDLSSLCAGTYHLWFVYYSRMGRFLKGVNPIFITFPSCQCSQS